MDWTYFLPCLWAFLACIGFCLVYNIRTGILYCCAGGALGWLIYLLSMLIWDNDYFASFLAALVIALYAEVMARIRKFPVTGYVLVSLLPLVPGAGVYYTMQYALGGDTDLFLHTGLHTMGVAGCLALGVLVASSVVRMVTTFRKGRKRDIQ